MADSNDNVFGSYKRRLLHRWDWYDCQHDPKKLDGKQRHTGFDYYEHDSPKIDTPGWAQSSFDRSHKFRDLEDPEHNHARHQGINGQGRDQSCYKQRDRPVIGRTLSTGIWG